MKILITGSAGFIGSHTAERFADSGHTVIGIDCFTPYYNIELKKLNAQDIAKKGVETINRNLATDDITDLVKDVDIAFHMAAQPGISETTPFDIFVKNNIVATHNLMEALKAVPNFKGLINISTSSIYGAHATDSEEAPPKPTSLYGVTKLGAEQELLANYRDGNFPTCSLRLFSVYGERERPEKLYPKLIKCIFEDTEFPLFEGSEHHKRSYTYIADVVDSFVAVVENLDKCLGEIINIGIDKVDTTGEGIEIVEEIIGKKAKIKNVPKRAGDQLETRANIEKARRLLGYEPKTPLREGLEKQVKWFEEKFYA